MVFSDTHTHLYLEHFDNDREEMITRAFNAGVTKMLLPNINSSTIKKMLAMETRYPEFCFPMMGLHPCYVNKNVEEEINLVTKWHKKKSFIAIGEIGLDFYHSSAFSKEQKWAFKQQLILAKKKDLPVSIHCRNAFNEVFTCFDELGLNKIKGVFHCFTGNFSDAKKILSYGLKLGIGGVVCFQNSKLDSVLSKISLSSIVLETDSPYLAPTPHRGKRNESAYLNLVAKKISAIFKSPLDTVSKVTEQTVLNVFGV